MNGFNQARFSELLRTLYDMFPSGGPFHIVTDDKNLETTHVIWCLMHYYDHEIYSKEENEWLKAHENDMCKLMEMLLELTEDERYEIDWTVLVQ